MKLLIAKLLVAKLLIAKLLMPSCWLPISQLSPRPTLLPSAHWSVVLKGVHGVASAGEAVQIINIILVFIIVVIIVMQAVATMQQHSRGSASQELPSMLWSQHQHLAHAGPRTFRGTSPSSPPAPSPPVPHPPALPYACPSTDDTF